MYGGFHGSLSWHNDGLRSSLREPCIKGTRIDVANILGRFAAGDKIEDIQEDYRLTLDQVMAALAYATHVTQSNIKLYTLHEGLDCLLEPLERLEPLFVCITA